MKVSVICICGMRNIFDCVCDTYVRHKRDIWRCLWYASVKSELYLPVSVMHMWDIKGIFEGIMSVICIIDKRGVFKHDRRSSLWYVSWHKSYIGICLCMYLWQKWHIWSYLKYVSVTWEAYFVHIWRCLRYVSVT